MIYFLVIFSIVAILVFLEVNYSFLQRLSPTEDNRSATALSYVDRGIKKFQAGDHKGAIADYNEALRLKSDCALAFYNRGVAKGKLRDRQGALVDLNEAARLSQQQGQMDDYRRAIALIALIKN
ncbi:tetratricopeptide repeat protein [Tumidithrix helvetica PCC 7403]|uniref:tetratricopeptide repeat protein n=1 Tax=Tumidithrix helvetica TaxID=3457545 RepID=UPI003CBBA6F5